MGLDDLDIYQDWLNVSFDDGSRAALCICEVAHAELRVRLQADDGLNDDEMACAMTAIERAGITPPPFSAYKPVIDLGVLVILALSSSGFMTILLVTLISPWFFASIVPQPAVQEGEQPGGGVPG